MRDLVVRAAQAVDAGWRTALLTRSWGGTSVVSRGRVHDAAALPALVAIAGEQPVGLVTYRIDGEQCELVTLDAAEPARGAGTALLAAVAERAGRAGCRRLWLVTTNDNLPALRFYQRRGMRLVAVHRGAADEARRLKPSIPTRGHAGIPIHDELELELAL